MATELLELVGLAQCGEKALARERLASAWSVLGAGELFSRCVLAHYLADLQESPWDELTWDLRALEAAMLAEPGDFRDRLPGVTLESFFPSLHLNVAAAYEKVEDWERARSHAEAASRASECLPDDGLGRMTRQGIAALRARLALR